MSIRWYEDGTLNASYNCIDRHLATRGDQTAILWEGDDPGEDRRVTYRELHESVCRLANALKAQGRQEGRPGHDLSADDPRGGGRDAGLRPHRRDPFGRVRRLLAGQPRRAHRGLRLDDPDHRRRGAARRPQGAAEAQRRHGAQAMPRRRDRHRRQAHRRRHRLGRGPRSLVSRDLRRRLARLSAGGDVGRGPAVHPLHLGIDRQAEGRAAHDRRLSRLHGDDARIRLRLPRRRDLLVHRRCRLGHRAQLHRLRPASPTARRP